MEDGGRAVVSTSTSESPAGSKAAEPHESGFTLIELVLGLSLAVILALAVAPLWISLQSGSAREVDQTVRLLQERVAVSRFERDLRLASAADCPFALTAPIVEADRLPGGVRHAVGDRRRPYRGGVGDSPRFAHASVGTVSFDTDGRAGGLGLS